jgi:DnaA N-terminal domain
VSRTAIAAALALEDVSGGERLASFALASFANRDQLAWPGTEIGAARAGLGRSRYLEARNQLLARGLIESCERGGGTGRSTVVLLRFADGPRMDRPVNPELFETVLCYSRSTGPGRLLLASIAALAGEHRELDGVTADQLSAVAGLAARTYRRARSTLIASGELELLRGLGGRGQANRWRIADLRIVGQPGLSGPRREARTGPARQLMTPAALGTADVNPVAAWEARCETTPSDAATEGGTASLKGGQDRTVSAVKGGQDRTVSTVKGGQARTVSAAPKLESQSERGSKRGPERGPPNARAWKEPGNQRTGEHPPNPPEGGPDTGELFIEESYLSERGRKRNRRVRVDADVVHRQLTPSSTAEREVWRNARGLMLNAVGESTFDIWLAPVELLAVDREGLLVLTGPKATLSWVQQRFGGLISDSCAQCGHRVRFASPRERAAIQHRPRAASSAAVGEQETMNRRVS